MPSLPTLLAPSRQREVRHGCITHHLISHRRESPPGGFFPRCLADPDAARHRLLTSGDIETNPGPAPQPQRRGLRILQLNLNGWKRRRLVLLQALQEWKVDVAVLQETNLQEKDDVRVPGFTYRRDGTVHRGGGPAPHGGLLTLVRSGILHAPATPDLPNLPAGSAPEVLNVTIPPPQSKPVTNIYRPPGRRAHDDALDTSPYTWCWPTGPNTFILGDINGHGS